VNRELASGRGRNDFARSGRGSSSKIPANSKGSKANRGGREGGVDRKGKSHQHSEAQLAGGKQSKGKLKGSKRKASGPLAGVRIGGEGGEMNKTKKSAATSRRVEGGSKDRSCLSQGCVAQD